jgi:hypothetical protein
MFGNMPEIRFEYFDMVVFDNAGGGGGGWGALLVMRSPLYGVVDFHGL